MDRRIRAGWAAMALTLRLKWIHSSDSGRLRSEAMVAVFLPGLGLTRPMRTVRSRLPTLVTTGDVVRNALRSRPTGFAQTQGKGPPDGVPRWSSKGGNWPEQLGALVHRRSSGCPRRCGPSLWSGSASSARSGCNRAVVGLQVTRVMSSLQSMSGTNRWPMSQTRTSSRSGPRGVFRVSYPGAWTGSAVPARGRPRCSGPVRRIRRNLARTGHRQAAGGCPR